MFFLEANANGRGEEKNAEGKLLSTNHGFSIFYFHENQKKIEYQDSIEDGEEE